MNKKQEKFCKEYIKDFNAAQAAIRAGYSKRTAKVQASRLLTKVNVQEKIAELSKKATKRNDVTLDEVIQNYTKLMRYDVSEMYNEKGEFKNIHDMPEEIRYSIESLEMDSEGKIIKIKLFNKRQTLSDLTRYFGGFKKDNEQKRPIAQIVGMQIK